MSKTERMRQYLREHGSARGITLAMEADLASVSLVSALLDGDIKKGRVTFNDGHYFWDPAFDEALHQEIEAAKALLVRHGYEVRRKATPTPHDR